MQQVNWGILGCGDVCEKKAGPALRDVAGSNLIAVMRRSADKAEDFAKRHGIGKWYADVDALLADDQIDTIYVATPDAAHHEGTLAALRAGKDVLVEKAMASNTAQCDEMIAEAKKLGRRLAVAYYRRGYPTILRARQLIDEGAIGELREICINDEFPLSHRLDLMHFFAGEMETVWSVTEQLPFCSAQVQGPMLYCQHRTGTQSRSGVESHRVVSKTPAGWDENLVAETLDFRGTTGRILMLDLKGGRLVLHQDGKKKVTEDLGPLPATHWGLIENYVKHVNGEAPLACDGIEGRKSTVILDIVAELQPDGDKVEVNYG